MFIISFYFDSISGGMLSISPTSVTYIPLYLRTYIPLYVITYIPLYLTTYIPLYVITYIPLYLIRRRDRFMVYIHSRIAIINTSFSSGD